MPNDVSSRSRLKESLLAYLTATARSASDTCIDFCIDVLLQGPLEQGLQDATNTSVDPSGATDECAESRACKLWMDASLGQNEVSHGELTKLLNGPLWQPVRSLVYRLLAHLGRYRELGTALRWSATCGPAELEAWIDAAPAPDVSGESLDLVETYPSWPKATWQLIQQAEGAIASTPAASLDFDRFPVSLPELEAADSWSSRVQLRTNAALAVTHARARLAQRVPLDGIFTPALPVPQWLRCYLSALDDWQSGNHDHARQLLEHSVRLAPQQYAPGLALATLMQGLGESIPEHLIADADLRELCIARAALLALGGRAPESLAELTRSAEWGPTRFTWHDARAAWEQRNVALTTALLEHQGEHHRARQAWSRFRGDRLLRDRRSDRIDGASPSSGSTHSGSRPETSRASGDALYYLALSTTDRTARARLLKKLLADTNWVSAESRCGGRKLVRLGDMLLGLGHLAAAQRAYTTVGGTPLTEKRQKLVEQLMSGAGSNEPGDGAAANTLEQVRRYRRGETVDVHGDSNWALGLQALATEPSVLPEAALAGLEELGWSPAAVALLCCYRTKKPGEHQALLERQWPDLAPWDAEESARQAISALLAAGHVGSARVVFAAAMRRQIPIGDVEITLDLADSLDAARRSDIPGAEAGLKRMQRS